MSKIYIQSIVVGYGLDGPSKSLGEFPSDILTTLESRTLKTVNIIINHNSTLLDKQRRETSQMMLSTTQK
ncbi:hypothetical protein BELL_0149g00030 [Botrytis elliptica]|uniref:Uncharacterized protein n=1 Tax=Botrytis elliptica TaxID=278938 RepID=A0A4Z1JRW6_9HELO|nr:hypothetical protein BELL_0149g00030 [Botrytis elliptica]